MESYDSTSCSALEKLHYQPIEAALRWCNLIQHEGEILRQAGSESVPPLSMFPQWPCLRANTEKILDATENGDLVYGRDGRTVASGDRVARSRLTIRHTDLKAWMLKHHADQKPKFLFDEVERNTHASYNAATFAALQAERDAARVELESAKKWAAETVAKLSELQDKCNSLEAMVDKLTEQQKPPGARAEATYLNIIGGLLGLMLGKTDGGQQGSVYQTQSAIVCALVATHVGKPGIADSTLEQKFAEARRSIGST